PYLLDTLQSGAKGIMAIVSSCSSLPERLWALRDRLNGEEAETVHAGLVFLDAVLRMGYPAAGKYVVNASGCPFPLATRWPVRLAPEATRALDAFVQFAARLG
ncbi:MAG TPA: hypothetical protein VFK80_00720, partial [Limnochordia bacterium]|nr:hypothetical protein [Limnochordia bacterium]